MAVTQRAGWWELNAAADKLSGAVGVTLIEWESTGGAADDVVLEAGGAKFTEVRGDPAATPPIVTAFRPAQPITLTSLGITSIGGTLTGILRVFVT
jgi:hypothetical protein